MQLFIKSCWRCASGQGGPEKYRLRLFIQCAHLQIFLTSLTQIHVKSEHRILGFIQAKYSAWFQNNLFCVHGLFSLQFFFPCPSLELCAVSFVTASSAGLELGRGELFQQTELCWLWEVGLALFCHCSSCSGVICNCAYTQIPSVIKVTQAVNLQDKVYQLSLGEVFLIPGSGDSARLSAGPLIFAGCLWWWQDCSEQTETSLLEN